MANIYAVKSGNWSDLTVWSGGALPQAVDNVYPQNFIVTIDTSVSVALLDNQAVGGPSGGSFSIVSGGITVTASLQASAATLVNVNVALPGVVTINDVTGGIGIRGGGVASSVGVVNSGTGTLNINSNCFGGSGTNAHAINNSGTGTVNVIGTMTGGNGRALNNNSTGSVFITGTCNGGTSSNNVCIVNASSGSITINGNCTAGAGSNAYAVNNAAGGTVNITGTCTSNGGSAVINVSTGTVNITGDCVCGTVANIHGVLNSSTGIINITGNCTGSTAANASCAFNNSTGTINITGTCTGSAISSNSYGANNSSTGTLNHVGIAQATNAAPAIVSASSGATTLLSGPLLTSANGCNPVYALRWQWSNTSTSPTYYEVRRANLTLRPLYSLDSFSAGTPATSNVRQGTAYGPNNALTGTLAVPSAGSVLLGVPVDATTGTATVTAADIRGALGMNSANLDTQLSALSTGQTTINNNVSTRLAAAAYTTPPTVTQVRQEMDANSTKLANLDATVSSRSTYAGDDTSGTTTLLSRLTATRAGYLDNISTAPPSAATIAFTVWQTLTSALTTAGSIGKLLVDNVNATISSAAADSSGVTTLLGRLTSGRAANLDNLDAAVSSRLASASYSAPPSAATNASAVRTELAPELGNLDATVSSRLPSSGYTAPPSAASIATAAWSAANRTLTANPGPSAADNATAVRTELNTELSRIDATVSSRLKPSDTLARVTLTDTATSLTNAPTVPTPGQIADEVRTELTPELSRVANCATTQEVGDIVQDALET